ncbi:hypothetical protein GCM10025867_30950 [Frondihabitans sucicola]|uniref:Uncharacterized protein n=1 Tax=Frondihabitans sucicola TaxID=1268041 RepID=A0ABM8GR05_9MICO|nr:hypothetical protein [Frondihabitans sucicola]BDZ50854.1 hypothetical protein GCM10025867_30950 [Frondihabitans sucicola]
MPSLQQTQEDAHRIVDTIAASLPLHGQSAKVVTADLKSQCDDSGNFHQWIYDVAVEYERDMDVKAHALKAISDLEGSGWRVQDRGQEETTVNFTLVPTSDEEMTHGNITIMVGNGKWPIPPNIEIGYGGPCLQAIADGN